MCAPWRCRRFGLDNIRDGEPVALLQDRFVPLYFYHRFAITSAARAIGGMEYANAVKGDGQQATRLVEPARQRAALKELLRALSPAELAVPDTVITLLAPAPPGYSGGVELFNSRTRPAFDEHGAMATLSAMVIEALLQKDRAARLVQFAPRQKDPLTLAELFDALAAATGMTGPLGDARTERVHRVTRRVLVDRTIQLAADQSAGPGVRAMANFQLTSWHRIAVKRAAQRRRR